jgi:uncharacterized membrane protein YbhN (UPF0104 family)
MANNESKWKRWFTLLRIAISISLLAVLVWRMNWQQLGQAFRQLQFQYWFAALGIYLAAQMISAFRWQALARPLGFEGPLSRYGAFYFVGMFFNMMLPTSVGGDVVRAWYLDNRPGRRLHALVSVLVDRASGLLVLLGLACVAMALCPIILPRWVSLSVWATALAALAGILLLPFLHRWTSRFDRPHRLLRAVAVYRRCPRLLIGTSILSLIVQAANVGIVWIIGKGMDLHIPDSYYWIFVPMVTLLTMLPVSLNGMGVREGSTIVFLTPVNIAAGDAFSLSVIWFTVFVAASLLGWLVYLLGCYPKPAVEAEHEALCCHPDQGRTGESPTAA